MSCHLLNNDCMSVMKERVKELVIPFSKSNGKLFLCSTFISDSFNSCIFVFVESSIDGNLFKRK